jgi:hypothetical protein
VHEHEITAQAGREGEGRSSTAFRRSLIVASSSSRKAPKKTDLSPIPLNYC